MASRRVLLGVLLAGMVLRAGILWSARDLGTPVADERQYVQLATSLLEGRGFAWATGERTSLRPPLYPAFVAGVWRLTGTRSLWPVRVAQCLLSFLTAVLVYALARRAFNARVATLAAAIVWLYPALLLLDVTILSETLFTFWLVAFVLLAVLLVQQPSVRWAAGCGVALGLGALTRSVLWPLPVVLCPLLALLIRAPVRQRLILPALVLAGYAVVVTPWAYRNTRLQRVPTVVDTMGGMNLRMGNYEFTPEDRMWDAVSMSGERSWVYALSQDPAARTFTEGMKDKWAQRKALEYIAANPGTSARRAAIKFADFWGLDRSFIAGVQQGLYRPPTWFVVLATAASLAACVAVLAAGAAGLWLAPPDWRVHLVLLLPIAAITAVHSIVFGHPRYHDPLIPLLAIYAAALIVRVRERTRHWAASPAWGAAATLVLLVAIWTRQVFFVDSGRVRALVDWVR